MKIAMIGHKRIPSREGGVEICVEELSARMVKLGHEVHAYNRISRGFSKNREHGGVRIINIPTVNKKSLDALVYSFLATIRAIFGGYDVIHYHALGPSVMAFLPKLFGKRVVCTVHGLDWQRAKWGRLAKAYLVLGERMAAKRADRVIVLSENVRQYFKNTYGRETDYIPNGANRPVNRPPDLIKTEYGLDKDSYILFLARIVPEKGLHYLIEAYSQLDTGVRLVICGGSSHTDAYLESVRKQASGDVRILFTGFVSGQKLEELYSNALIYVLPSDIEGMPLSLLDALSFGNCCLVSDIPENREVVRDMGFTHAKGDVASLRDALARLLSDRELVRETAERAGENILSRFNWDDTADKTLRCYQSI